MNKKAIRRISFIICLSLMSSMFAGCGKSKDTSPTANPVPSSVADAAKGSVYPLKTNATLKWWHRIPNGKLNGTGDTEWAQLLSKKTGVKFEFVTPPNGKESDAFNILLASGDLPDIVSFHWGSPSVYPGGASKALADGVALQLNDVMDKWAPNLKKVLASNPEWDKQSKTDDGKYWMFPFIRGDQSLTVFQGPIIRKDWLDELGLQVPETIDEWYTVLKAFKEKKAASAPLSVVASLFSVGGFVGAYGVKRDFYQENGKVKYGPMEAGYKDFLVTMKKWYEEGLLDKDFATITIQTQNSNMMSGKTGAVINNSGGGIGTFLNTMKEKDAKYNVAGAPYPVLKKGDKPKFGQMDFAVPGTDICVVNPKSKNIEVAVRVLDYGYSEEGHMLMNFGEEGVSYTLVNGFPTYSELITKNPKGYTVSEALGSYVNGTNNSSVQDKRISEQPTSLQQQKDAVKTWTHTDAAKYSIPNVTFTTEESQQYNKIMVDINTYENEMFLKFVIGAENIENFDKYVDQLKKLGIEKAISLKQAALERYNKR